MRRLLAPLVALLVLGQSVHAQFAPAPAAPAPASDLDAKVEEARQKGVDYIVSQQQIDGSWVYEKHEVGITALCTLALIENGLSPTNEVVKKGVDYVRENAKGNTSTYDIALSIVLLSKIGSRRDKDLIQGLAASLLAGQLTSGGWTYTCPKGTKAMLTNPRGWPERKTSPGDNSCTQFAVLGLWTASRDNVDIENAMAGVARRFVYFQNPDGGWGYRLPTAEAADGENAADDAGENPEPDQPEQPDQPRVMLEPSRNSMTFAGLFCLTVARATKIRAEQDAERRGRTRVEVTEQPAPVDGVVPEGAEFEDAGSEADTLFEDPIFGKGLDKAGQYAAGIAPNAAMYFIWSVERMGVMLGMDEINGIDWFAKSADAMIRTQRPDGSWAGGHGELSNTAFAILVLRKANLGSDITRLLKGEPAQPFGIVDSEKRFDTLADAIAAADPGATIRVEGDGPFQMPHLDVDTDLVIQAGFGYEPVFQYDAGFDKFGVRTRPDRDAESRCMIRTTAGTLTLEGLKLEMDPPFTTAKDLDWTAAVADGGNLRLLNCTLTEQAKRGVVAVRLLQPGTHVVRNCVLSTTVAAVYVNGTGQQDVTIDNSILFGDIAVDVRQDTQFKGESQARLLVTNSTIQAREAFRFLTLETFPVPVIFEGNVVQADVLASYLASAGKGTPRTWSGGLNVYDVQTWVGVKRKADTSVRDLKTWAAFQGTEEEAGSRIQIASFVVRRPLASYSHRVRPEDWELSEERIESGVYALTVGTGRGYSRFRSTIQYNQWQSGEETVVASR